MAKKKEKKVRISEKQKKWVGNKLMGKSDRQAAVEAGYSKSVVDNVKADIKEKPGTQAFLNQLGIKLEEIGVTDEKLAKKLEEGLEATSLFGKEATEHEDYRTRLEYLRYIGELKGHQVKQQIDLTTKDQPLNQLEPGDYAAFLKERNKSKKLND